MANLLPGSLNLLLLKHKEINSGINIYECMLVSAPPPSSFHAEKW